MNRVLPRGADVPPYEPVASRIQHECGALAVKLGTGRKQIVCCPDCPFPTNVDKPLFPHGIRESFENRAARRRA